MQHLGFVTDPHQICVGITRAKFGLIIVGESLMLYCTLMEVVSMHAYESSRTHTVTAEIVTMRSSYFANFTRSWLKVRLKLDRKLHEVRSKLAQTSYKVDLHVCTHFKQSGLKLHMQSFPAKFASKWKHIFRAYRIYLHEYCIMYMPEARLYGAQVYTE